MIQDESRLITYGCSFTFGTALDDKWDFEKKEVTTAWSWRKGNETPPEDFPSKYAWPQVLANTLGIECINKGIPGISNKEIWDRILKDINDFKKTDIVIILWTFFNRHCIILDADDHTRYRTVNIEKIFRGIRANKYSEMLGLGATRYVENFFNEHDNKLDFYLRLNHINELLKDKVNLIHLGPLIKHRAPDSYTEQPPWNNVNLAYIDADGFVNKFFYQDLTDSRRALTKANDDRHPGIEGHAQLAEYIYKKLIT